MGLVDEVLTSDQTARVYPWQVGWWVVGGSSMCNEGYLEGVKVSSSTLHDKVKPHPILGTRHVLQSFQCALSVRP